MAALPVGYHYHTRGGPITELRSRKSARILILQSYQSRGPVNESNSQEKKIMGLGEKLGFLKLLNSFENLGKRVKQNLSPQQKGDWKDLLLMSLSFAVYVYISQKLVCAYCAWTSIPKQPW
ncbi:uncharacterized protein LOC129314632 [Prosopis cineraria]|uniref:uncharacterized protein LOC129314632 n=1 Tax=Prosopis cineraria TaxID=364024 RepID=UPI00240F062F|nr:uncharacterized protein LOC129314632 [Prosopis cineraria]